MSDLIHSELLLDSLLSSPLLVNDLGGHPHLDRGFFELAKLEAPLNFSQKLGHLYEDALEHILRSHPDVTDLYCSIQVFADGGRTMGEFDYLFRYRGEIIHLELAVKFYCAVRPIEGADQLRWYGPDARDHWDRKHQRMLSHQLEIAQTKEGQDTIEKLFGGRDSKTKHLIYGRLFDPINAKLSEAIDVSQTASRGMWIWRSELADHITAKEIWVIPKCLWPCEISATLLSTLEKKTHEELLTLSEQRAVMFTDGRDFYFIVHDEWLDGAALD
ncbi:DUF1853 family protein [Akkermansiaceae bacterium]|nr:DUF1853 family protein [Akkermansiaceae bacterium]